MRSYFMNSAVALSLIASPTVALAQNTISDDQQRAVGALFVGILFAVVLLANAGSDDEGTRVSP
jgi:hypothetical protein